MNHSGLQSLSHNVSEVRSIAPAVLLQPARAVEMNSQIHDKCGHMVEQDGQARGAKLVLLNTHTTHTGTTSVISHLVSLLEKRSHQTLYRPRQQQVGVNDLQLFRGD